jgi:hypothetical protein
MFDVRDGIRFSNQSVHCRVRDVELLNRETGVFDPWRQEAELARRIADCGGKFCRHHRSCKGGLMSRADGDLMSSN